MKNVIERRHLAPYISHGVKVQLLKQRKFSEKGHPMSRYIGTLSGVYYEYGSIASVKREDGEILDVNEGDFKLILRPLSILNDEIQHNGKKFIPMQYLYKHFPPLTKSIEGMYNDLQNPLNHRYDVVEKLFEWKFNVFNLPKELCIDVFEFEEEHYQ